MEGALDVLGIDDGTVDALGARDKDGTDVGAEVDGALDVLGIDDGLI